MNNPEMSNVRREIAFPGRISECDLRRRDIRECASLPLRFRLREYNLALMKMYDCGVKNYPQDMMMRYNTSH